MGPTRPNRRSRLKKSATPADCSIVKREIVIQLHISSDEFMQHYRGIPNVRAQSIEGQQILFPASALRAFVTREGVHGTFSFQIASSGKLLTVRRLS